MSKRDTLIIAPGLASRYYWMDLWRFRELFVVLAWRDLSVRYKQTVVGLGWAIARPLLSLIVLSTIFGRLARMPTEGTAPYALLVFAGLLPWQLISGAISEASSSLIGSANLISKVYFPRMIVPVASIVVALVDFGIGLGLLFGLMAYYRFLPGWQIVLLPCFVLMAVLACIGPSLLLAALNVKYRDFRYAVPFLVQMGLYASPVGFSSAVVPDRWRLLFSLNPVVGVLDGFRWSLLGGATPFYVPGFLASWGVIIGMLWLGIRQFRKMESSFADLV